jgi:hypothetical protein
MFAVDDDRVCYILSHDMTNHCFSNTESAVSSRVKKRFLLPLLSNTALWKANVGKSVKKQQKN